MQIVGRIKSIFDERNLKENFNIREFVLTTEENTPYPQTVLFQLINHHCDDIIGKHVGDEVEVFFELKGKYGARTEGYNHLPYNRLEVYRIYKNERE